MSIKDALYGACGRKKLGQPEYTFFQERQRFRCQAQLAGVDYVGIGVSTNKKDAQTNAAKDLGEFLVRQGHLQPGDVPQLQAEHLEAFAVVGPPPEEAPAADSTEPALNPILSPSAAPQPSRPRTKYEEYVEHTAQEVEKSECVDLTAEIHGGWTINNCKKALNEYLQGHRLPAAQYKMESNGPPHNRTFVANFDLYVTELSCVLHGRGEGSNTKLAQTICALSLVRQLYHKDVLRKSTETSSKKKVATDLPATPVTVNADLLRRVDAYLAEAGVAPALFDFGLASAAQRIPLTAERRADQCAEEAAASRAPGLVAFAPPAQNWDAWRGANIDQPPLATMAPAQVSADLLARERAKVHGPAVVRKRKSLPVFAHRDQILRAVADHPVVLIKGTTGCGKSTQVCQYLLDDFLHAGRGAQFNCIVSQPRRISTISLAERVANERMEEVGQSVGYAVRFENVYPRPYGAVLFCTVGVLLRKLEFGLRGVSHLIIDEIHERDVNTDFLLIIVRDMVRAYPELRVVLMSATIETSLFTSYFGTSAVVEIEQRVFDVQHFFLETILQMIPYQPEEDARRKRPRKRNEPGAAPPANDDEQGDDETDAAADGDNLNAVVAADVPGFVRDMLAAMDEQRIPVDLIEAILMDIASHGLPGAVLVFLPGMALIEAVQAVLKRNPVLGDPLRFLLLPLHSQLPSSEQRKVFQQARDGQRKVILATNIAETSITIDDVVYVIDSCRAREASYTPRNNMLHFTTVWASRNSLIQRRGRAGRVQEGFCFHLCTQARFDALEEHRTPEMLRTPLDGLALAIKLLRLGAVGDFLERAIEPPPLDAVVEAEVLLREMGALDRRLELTRLGHILAKLPVKPREGKALVLAAALSIGDLMCTIEAAADLNSPFVPLQPFHRVLSNCHRRFAGRRLSDHAAVLNVNNQFCQAAERGAFHQDQFTARNSLSPIILGLTKEAKLQMRDVLVHSCAFPESAFAPLAVDVDGQDQNLDLLMGVLVYALYPNIAYYRDKRRVFTLEQASALLSKMSVCVPPVNVSKLDFRSPLLVFTDKVRTTVISAKTISMVTPLQLLLFGSRRVECVGPTTVRLDDMISLEMSPVDAAKIVALRPCVEALIVRTALNPAGLESRAAADLQLVDLLRHICAEEAWAGTAPRHAPPAALYADYQQRRRFQSLDEQGQPIGGRRHFAPRQRPEWVPRQRPAFSQGRLGYRGGFRGGRGSFRGGSQLGYGGPPPPTCGPYGEPPPPQFASPRQPFAASPFHVKTAQSAAESKPDLDTPSTQ